MKVGIRNEHIRLDTTRIIKEGPSSQQPTPSLSNGRAGAELQPDLAGAKNADFRGAKSRLSPDLDRLSPDLTALEVIL